MEALERRALLMLVVVALLFLRALGVFPSPTWLVAVYIFGLACLTAASILLVVVVAPAMYVGRWDSERQRFLFLAFALLVSDIVVTALIFAYSAYPRQTTGSAEAGARTASVGVVRGSVRYGIFCV